MSLAEMLKDIAPATIWTAFVGAIGFTAKEFVGLLRDKNGLKKTEIEKAPDLERAKDDAIFKLLNENRNEITLLRSMISELRDEVADLNDHIDNLTGVLKANNITPPPRRRRAKSETTD